MTEQPVVDIYFNRPQQEAYEWTQQCRTSIALAWGRGTGKTWFIRDGWWLRVAEFEHLDRQSWWNGYCAERGIVDVPKVLTPMTGVRIISLMPTLKQFKDVYADGILRDLEGDWKWLRGKVDRTTWSISFPGGSWIKPFPAAEHSSKTARGMRCDVITCDEMDDIDAGVYDGVAVPWLSEPWSLGIRIGGGTPRRGRHGLLYRQYKAGQIGARLRRGERVEGLREEQITEFPKTHSILATYRDAPQMVSKEAVNEAKANCSKAVFQREWECNFDAAEGLVYGDVFDERYHVADPPPGVQWTEYLIGADHGWENPGVLLLIGVLGHGKDAICWVLDEVYEQHRADSWWAATGAVWFQQYPHKFYPDPSRPGLIRDYQSVGARLQEVDNSIEDGVAAVADRLVVRKDDDGTAIGARLFISPKCVHTIAEFGKYRRKQDPADPDRYLDDIIDKDNHCLVPGTLVLTSRGEIPIESVTTEDEVLTRAGWRRVVWSGKTGETSSLVEVSAGSSTVCGTPDHLAWTENRGWVRLDGLRYGDIMLAPSFSATDTQRPALVPVLVRDVRAVAQEAELFDLTVDEEHEFVANGLVVHNSMDALRYAVLSRFGRPPSRRFIRSATQYQDAG